MNQSLEEYKAHIRKLRMTINTPLISTTDHSLLLPILKVYLITDKDPTVLTDKQIELIQSIHSKYFE